MSRARRLPVGASATALYARVTREEGIELSIPNQQKRFRELVEQHDWSDARLFVEERPVHGDWGPARRPALTDLLAAIRAGEVRRLVVRHLDRLGRGPVLEDLINVVSKHGVELHTFDGPVPLRSAADRLGVRAQAMVGAFEVERGGERVREMKRQKARSGIYVGPTPYGWTSQARMHRELTSALGPDEARRQAEAAFPHRGELSLDPDEAPVVQEIFRLFVDDRLGARAISRTLTDRGIRTRKGKRFSTQRIGAMLRNPLYAGFTTFAERDYETKRFASTPVHDQERYEGRHPAIVTRATFAAAEVRWRSNQRPNVSPTRSYLLAGLLRCPHGHRGKAKSGGASRFYTCCHRANHGPDSKHGGCDAPPVPVAFADAAVTEALSRLLSDPEALHAQLAKARRERVRAARRPTVDLQALHAAKGKQEAIKARCLDLVLASAAGTPAEAALLERVSQAQERLDDLQRQLNQATQAEVLHLVAPPRIEEVRDFAASLPDRNSASFRPLLEALAEHHGLVVTLAGRRHLRLTLQLDVRGDGNPLTLTVDAEGEREEALVEWVERQQGQHLCACGCGEAITVRPRHRSLGLPRYRREHTPSAYASRIIQANAEGLVTVAQAADQVGWSENKVRQHVTRGWLPFETRRWGKRDVILVRRDDLHSDRLPTLWPFEVQAALGLARSRWQWLVRQEVLPADKRFRPADVPVLGERIAAWEAAQWAAVAADGLVTRAEAQDRLGVKRRAMQRLISVGALNPVWRPVTSARRVQLFRIEEVGDGVATEAKADTG